MAGNLVEAKPLVVVRADPLGGVDRPALQRGKDLAPGNLLHVDSEPIHHLATQTGDAHAQAVEIGERVDFAAEPAAHLDPRGAGGERTHVEIREHRGECVAAAALVKPAVLLARRQAEGHAGIEGQRGILADVVVARAVPDLRGALLNGVQHVERGHQLARGVGTDAKRSAGHRLQGFRERLRAAEKGVEAAGKARREPPGHLLVRLHRGSRTLGGGISRTTRQGGSGGAYHRALQEPPARRSTACLVSGHDSTPRWRGEA